MAFDSNLPFDNAFTFDPVAGPALYVEKQVWSVPGGLTVPIRCYFNPVCIGCDDPTVENFSPYSPPSGDCDTYDFHNEAGDTSCTFNCGCIPRSFLEQQQAYLAQYTAGCVGHTCNDPGQSTIDFAGIPVAIQSAIQEVCCVKRCIDELLAIRPPITELCQADFLAVCTGPPPAPPWDDICSPFCYQYFLRLFDRWCHKAQALATLRCMGITPPTPPIQMRLKLESVMLPPGSYMLSKSCTVVPLDTECVECPPS